MVSGASRDRKRQAEANREELLRLAPLGLTIPEMLERVGISRPAYERYRERHRDWYWKFNLERRAARQSSKNYDGTFIGFRLQYLFMATTPFQAQIVDAIERAEPGEVTMVLIPPGHGKTTLLEDWCTYKLVTDPSYRITVASETVDHSRKIIGRVRTRLESDGPTPQVHKDFGPFQPVEGKGSQPWGATHFNVAGKLDSDERDFSMNGVGITGRVQGTRCDLLLLDDIQDVKSIEQSDKYFKIIVQSFLSRPEMYGRTVIIGTRVDEFDVYHKLMDAEIPDHLVKMAAYSVAAAPTWPRPPRKPAEDDPDTHPPDGIQFLWGPDLETGRPGRYSPFQYAKLRYRIGEKAWARNYMQRPEAASDATFPSEVTDLLWDESRGVLADARPVGHNRAPVVLSLDPAIGGGNGLLAASMRPECLEVLHCRLDYDLTSYGQVFDLLDEYCWRYGAVASKIAEVVIEDKAFQRGLLLDDRLIEMQRRWGFRIVPNTTGKEKTDPDIGIPAMPESIRRGEITIPGATELDRQVMAPLIDHMHTWRPGRNGVKLPQDMVMALWFAWRRWRVYRNTPLHGQPRSDQFSHRASPLRSRAVASHR